MGYYELKWWLEIVYYSKQMLLIFCGFFLLLYIQWNYTRWGEIEYIKTAARMVNIKIKYNEIHWGHFSEITPPIYKWNYLICFVFFSRKSGKLNYNVKKYLPTKIHLKRFWGIDTQKMTKIDRVAGDTNTNQKFYMYRDENM